MFRSRWSRVAGVVFALCMMAAPALSQDGLGPRRRDAESKQVELAAGVDLANGVELPTRRCGDFFIVDAMVNGHGPFAMLLDTGASVSVLSPEAAKICGLRRHMDDLRIGPVQFDENLRCVTRDLQALQHAMGERFDGIVGHAVFEKVLLTYDYPNARVSVRTGSITDNLPGVAPMKKGARPFVSVDIAGRRSDVLLDTGFTGGLMLTGFARLPFISDPVPVGGRLGIDGLKLDKAARLDGDADLGCFTLRDPIVQSADAEGLLGQRVLRDFVLTVDQQRGRFQLVRPDGSAGGVVVQPEPLRGSGLLLDKQSDRMVVLKVFDGSSAGKAGVQERDAIVAIDGVLLAERGCALARPSGPVTRRYRVLRGDQQLEVEFADAVLVE